jgi:hypothetical protein
MRFISYGYGMDLEEINDVLWMDLMDKLIYRFDKNGNKGEGFVKKFVQKKIMKN